MGDLGFPLVKIDRKKDKEKRQIQDTGNRGRGGFSLALILRPLHTPFLDGMLHFIKATEKKKGYWQAKYHTAEKQPSNLLD